MIWVKNWKAHEERILEEEYIGKIKLVFEFLGQNNYLNDKLDIYSVYLSEMNNSNAIKNRRDELGIL